MLIRQAVVSPGAGNVIVTVPDTAVTLVAVAAVCPRHRDGIGAERDDAQIGISADLNSSLSSMIAGVDLHLLANGRTVFPEFPVSAGERLLVAFEEGGSAV